MDNRFNVVYTGLQEGISVEEFITKFCNKFGVSEKKAQQIASSTSDVVVKKNLDTDKAKKYASAFESCGIVVRLDEIVNEPDEKSGGLSLEPMAEEKEAEEKKNTPPQCGHPGIGPSESVQEHPFGKKGLGLYPEPPGRKTNLS